MPGAIYAEGLVKTFGDVRALDGVDLDVPEGTVLGLLGPNGAGKTTTVRVLTTLLQPDSGKAVVAGLDVLKHPNEVRRSIGLSGQFAAVDEYLTGRENLQMVGQLYQMSARDAKTRAGRLLERFNLADAADRPAKTYSGGMRRRLDLAAALVVSPPVMFMDEPTTGLDPRNRQQLWEVIQELVAGGTTLLLTTQYLEEADHLADRIALLDHGKLIAEGTAEELKRLVAGGHIVLRFHDLNGLEHAARLFDASVRDNDALTLQVPNDGTVRSLRTLLDSLDSASAEVEELSVHMPDLDDVFLALTGQPDTGSFDMQKETVR
jgi:ABC-2 type transport system ATP-binding protein